MKIKLLALSLLVTGIAFSTQAPAWALGLCPEDACGDFNNDCLANGGTPFLPMPTGEDCYTLPGHTQYSIAIATCQYPTHDVNRECYW